MGQGQAATGFDWDSYYKRMEESRIYSLRPLDSNENNTQTAGIKSKVTYNSATKFSVPFKIEGELHIEGQGFKFAYLSSEPCRMVVYYDAVEETDSQDVTTAVKAEWTKELNLPEGKGEFEGRRTKERALLIVKFEGKCNMFYYCYIRGEGTVQVSRYKLEMGGRGTHIGKLFNKGACVVCLCEESNTVLNPCKHMCLCEQCSKHLISSSRNCPVCRTKIAEVVNVT